MNWLWSPTLMKQIPNSGSQMLWRDMHFSQKLTQQLTLQCTQRSNLGVVHGGFTGIPNGLISSNSTVCRQVHVSFTTIHSSFCINCIHVRKSTCAVMVQWQTLQKEKHPQYSPVISTIQGTGRCQLELWVSASQKKALPVFLEKTATFRIGWMVYKYLAWVCSTCSTSNNIVWTITFSVAILSGSASWSCQTSHCASHYTTIESPAMT